MRVARTTPRASVSIRTGSQPCVYSVRRPGARLKRGAFETGHLSGHGYAVSCGCDSSPCEGRHELLVDNLHAVPSMQRISGTATMTSVTIELPDGLAEEARKRGLLSSEILAPVLSEMLRLQSGAELRDLLTNYPVTETAPSAGDIKAMIAAVRRQFRAA